MADWPNDFFDIPYGPLPVTERIQLEGNKIVSAIAEARFLRNEPGVSDFQADQIREILGKELFPFLEQGEQRLVNLTVTDGGVESSQDVVRVWQLFNEQRTLTVTLAPLAVNIQVLNYTHYQESIAEIFAEALRAYSEVTDSVYIQRLGLRYVNRLTDADAKQPTFWSSILTTSFAGPTVGPLGAFVQGARQQVQLQLEPTVGSVINSAIFQDLEAPGSYGCLLDIDVYDDKAVTFEPTEISNLTRKLNRTAYGLFAQTLTSEFLDKLKPKNFEESEGDFE